MHVYPPPPSRQHPHTHTLLLTSHLLYLQRAVYDITICCHMMHQLSAVFEYKNMDYFFWNTHASNYYSFYNDQASVGLQDIGPNLSFIDNGIIELTFYTFH